MLPARIIALARAVLSDQSATYRWPTADLVDYLNEGVAELWSRRPETRCLADGSVADRELVAYDAGTEAYSGLAAVDDEWGGALVDFVVYRALDADGVDEMNARAAADHLAAFERRVGP